MYNVYISMVPYNNLYQKWSIKRIFLCQIHVALFKSSLKIVSVVRIGGSDLYCVLLHNYNCIKKETI